MQCMFAGSPKAGAAHSKACHWLEVLAPSVTTCCAVQPSGCMVSHAHSWGGALAWLGQHASSTRNEIGSLLSRPSHQSLPSYSYLEKLIAGKELSWVSAKQAIMQSQLLTLLGCCMDSG